MNGVSGGVGGREVVKIKIDCMHKWISENKKQSKARPKRWPSTSQKAEQRNRWDQEEDYLRPEKLTRPRSTVSEMRRRQALVGVQVATPL